MDEVDLLVPEEPRAFSRPYQAKTEILIPVVRPLLAKIGETVGKLEVELPTDRPYDGWFHPSTHPMWDERQLYLYKTDPDRLEKDTLDDAAYLSAIHGTFWHTATQTMMMNEGMLLESDPAGKTLHDKAEVPVRDEANNTRGHLDGALNPAFFTTLDAPQGLEIKTLTGFRANDIPAGFPGSAERVEWLKKARPKYYWQAQEYMRMSGFRMQHFLFMGMDWPFPMAEVWLPYNEHDALSTVAKYQRVLWAIKNDAEPDPCCAVKSTKAKQCPVRGACSIGRLSGA